MTALMVIMASCASGGSTEQRAVEIRSGFLQAGTITAVANVTADYGDRVYEYKLKYTGDGESGTIELREPEMLSGLTAVISEGGAVLEYDGASLETGPITEDGLSPAAALPVMISEWKTGYMTDCTAEKYGDVSVLAVTIMVSETVELRTWFDDSTLLPLRAELSENGRTAIICTFENVTLE